MRWLVCSLSLAVMAACGWWWATHRFRPVEPVTPNPEWVAALADKVQQSNGRRTLVVSQDPDLAQRLGSKHFVSLADAVAQAEPGDVIRVVAGLLGLAG